MQTRTSGGVCARRLHLLATSALISLALLPAAPQSAKAQTVWNGSVSSDWNTNGNWTPGAVPTAADNVIIDTTSPNSTEINALAAAADQIFIDNGALSIINAGSLSTAGNVEIGSGQAQSVVSHSIQTQALIRRSLLGVASYGTLRSISRAVRM